EDLHEGTDARQILCHQMPSSRERSNPATSSMSAAKSLSACLALSSPLAAVAASALPTTPAGLRSRLSQPGRLRPCTRNTLVEASQPAAAEAKSASASWRTANGQ